MWWLDARLLEQLQCTRLLGLPLLMEVRLDWNIGGESGDVNGHGGSMNSLHKVTVVILNASPHLSTKGSPTRKSPETLYSLTKESMGKARLLALSPKSRQRQVGRGIHGIDADSMEERVGCNNNLEVE